MVITLNDPFDSYSEVLLTSGNENEIAEVSRLQNARFLSACLRDISEKDRFVLPNLRKYAFDLVSSGTFSTINPVTGKLCLVSNSYTFDDFLTIFFFIDADASFAIVASDLSLGCPITNVIIFDRKLLITIQPTFWTLKQRHFETLVRNGVTSISPLPESRQVCLVAGDSNFAHHTWNELSALETIANLGLDSGICLYAFHETLGPINAILGSNFKLSGKLIKAEIHRLHGEGRLTFAAAGNRITKSLLDKIQTFARREASDVLVGFLNFLASKRGNVLWVSVRTRNRTMTNQTEALSAVICAYLAKGPDRAVVLDGHSLPHDYEQDPDFLKAINDEVVAYDDATIESVVTAVRQLLPDAQIYPRCGDKIHESILIAQEMGVYFCHHGTVQHKVGWFASVPGIVHCNRKVLESRPAHWVAEKSEIAILPEYVPDYLVGRFEEFSYDDDVQRNLSIENYFITDITELTSFAMNYFTSVGR